MQLAITPESVYQIVSDPECTVEEGGYSDRGCTARGIARRMGYDEMDERVHALIRSMRVAGFIVQSPLGGYNIGPTPLPPGRGTLPAAGPVPRQRPGNVLTDRFGRLWTHDAGEIYVHDKMAWLADRVTSPDMQLPTRQAMENPSYEWCEQCKRLFASAGPSGVPDGVDDVLAAANAQQAAADRRLLAGLEAADAVGDLVTHEPGSSCELGLWHTGPCPDEHLERQLVLDDRAEDRGAERDDMETCGVHRRWARDCVSNPDHSNPITKYNWCNLHFEPVQRCGCFTANLSGRPLPGEEPQHLAEDWVNWALDPRTRSEGTRGGMSVDTWRGNFRVLPHPDGRWRVEGPYGHLSYYPTRHQGLLFAVDNEVHAAAVRRPKPRQRPSGVPQGVVE